MSTKVYEKMTEDEGRRVLEYLDVPIDTRIGTDEGFGAINKAALRCNFKCEYDLFIDLPHPYRCTVQRRSITSDGWGSTQGEALSKAILDMIGYE